MKKLLCLFVAAVMAFTCAVSLAETVAPATQDEEMEAVLEWLFAEVPEDEAMQIFSWDKDTILQKLEDYDKPLQYSTKEELADRIAEALGMLGMFAGLFEGGSEADTRGGEGDFDLGGLLSLFGEESGTEGDAGSFDLGGLLGGETETEGDFDLGGLFGGLFGEESGTETDGDDFDMNSLLGMLGALGGSGDSGSLEGTWQSGNLQLEALRIEEYCWIMITGGETELSYLCELNPETGEYVSLGTGDEAHDAAQPDHGVAAFAFAEDGSLLWYTAAGEQIAFTRIY